MTPHDALLKALGQMSVNFSQLEETLIDYTATLINANDTDAGYVTLAGLNMTEVERIFKALVLNRLERLPLGRGRDEIRKRLNQAMGVIQNARDTRNRYVHSYWNPTYIFDEKTESVFESGEAELTRHTKDKKRDGEYVRRLDTCTASEIETVTKRIDEARRGLHAFVEKTNSLLEPGDALFPQNGFFRPA